MKTAALERAMLIISLVLVALVSGLAFESWRQTGLNYRQQDLTRQIVVRTNRLLTLMKDAETGQRGYLLTGDDRYLDPYRQAASEIPSALRGVIDAQHTYEPENRQAEELTPLVQSKLAELQRTIDLRRGPNGFEAALDVVRTDRGRKIMDRIRSIGSELEQRAYKSLQEHSERTRTASNRAGLTGVAGSAIVFVFLLLATVTIHRGTEERQALLESLSISERRTTQNRDWLQATLSGIGDGVIVTDDKANVVFLNGVAQALTGWTQTQAAGAAVEQVFAISHMETGAAVESPVKQVLQDGCLVRLANHTKLTSKDGRAFPIDDTAAPIRDAAGKLTGVVLVFRDVTERYKTDLELYRANEDLRQFAYAASHDLREPLRMITVYSQLLVKEFGSGLRGEASAWLGQIIDGSKRMHALLADLLAYTKLTGTEQEPDQAVDLNRVLQNCLLNLKPAMEETHAVVTGDSLPVVAGEEAHFLQLFQNLLSNALKYRSEREPRVHVSVEKEEGGWRFAVADNGLGIAPEYHQEIFGVFRRLHGEAIPGTGMGLAICKRVVERRGGKIWVVSQMDRGSTFYFTLPGH